MALRKLNPILGEPGEFRTINKDILNIDMRYQRDATSEVRVDEMARSWDWVQAGAIAVSSRPDGTYWVLDGGHRTRAAKLRDDIASLPCIVHKMPSVKEEAAAFLDGNTKSKSVNAHDRHKAAIVAEEEVALRTQSVIDDYSLTSVHGGQNGPKYLLCLNTLKKCVKADEATARKVLGFLLSLPGDTGVNNVLLKGMFALQKHFAGQPDVINVHGDRLSGHTRKELDTLISQFRVECGGIGGEAVAAKAILRLVNKGLRTKLIW